MTSLIKNVDISFAQRRNKRSFCLFRRSASFKGFEKRHLRSIECLASGAGRPFLQHELRSAVDARYRQPLADLPRLYCYRLPPPELCHGLVPPAEELSGLAIVPGRAA